MRVDGNTASARRVEDQLPPPPPPTQSAANGLNRRPDGSAAAPATIARAGAQPDRTAQAASIAQRPAAPPETVQLTLSRGDTLQSFTQRIVDAAATRAGLSGPAFSDFVRRTTDSRLTYGERAGEAAFAALKTDKLKSGAETATVTVDVSDLFRDAQQFGQTRADARGAADDLGRGLERIGGMDGLSDRAKATAAVQRLNSAGSAAFEEMSPDSTARLAGLIGRDPSGPAYALSQIQNLPPSANRDVLVRTLFLKTPGEVYRDPAQADAMAQAFAATGGGQPARARDFAQLLQTPEGRSLLTDSKVNGGSRLWMADQAIADPARMRSLLNGAGDNAWEHGPLLEFNARARTEQFAAARGNVAVELNGGADFANFVGAGLGTPLRPDLPQGEAQIRALQAQAANGAYNFYQGVEAVDKPAGGLAEAQRQMGGGPVRVSVLPVQFSSQESGPVDLQLYRLEGGNGQSRFVDNVGRVYADFEAWKTSNQLPPGKMTFPAHGSLADDGQTSLATQNTPNTVDTFWERVGQVGDVAALIGGVVASGVIIAASGGTATPLVIGAWGVALGSAAWVGGRAIGELSDRAAHGQTLSVTDPDARAAWLSLAGAGFTVAGAGATRLATMAANGSRLATNTARAAGILNATANYADAAATVDTAQSLVRNWNTLTPAQRAQMGLSIAFWGGMTGVSARASGGRVTDAFDFRTQINQAMIQSGAAVSARPTLQGDAVQITRDPGTGRITIEHGPQATPGSIRIHQDVAQLVVSENSFGARVARQLGGGIDPNSAAGQARFEAMKLRREVDSLVADLNRGGLTPARRQDAEFRLERLERDLVRQQTEFARAVGDPSLAAIEAQNTRRVPGRQDTTLGAKDVTLSLQAGTGGTTGVPPRYEARFGSGLEASSPEVRSFRQITAELTVTDATLTASRAAIGTGRPGGAADRAGDLVDQRANAATILLNRIAAAPDQAVRNQLMVDALHSHVQAGREANLLYAAVRTDPSLANAAPAQAVARLRTEAAAGRLNGLQVDDMARLGWLSEAQTQAARTRSGIASTRTFTNEADLNAAAAQASPFTTYVLRAANGRSGDYRWTTDHLGRTATITGTVTGPAAGRGSVQTEIGNVLGFNARWQEVPNGARRETDVGFHLVADPIAGPTNALNVVPGDGRLNNAAWKTQFENVIKAAHARGDRVEIRIDLAYDPGNVTRRPDSFSPQYRLNGGMWVNSGTLLNR